MVLPWRRVSRARLTSVPLEVEAAVVATLEAVSPNFEILGPRSSREEVIMKGALR
jgi:hypothetical protein